MADRLLVFPFQEYLIANHGYSHISVRSVLREIIKEKGMPDNRDSMTSVANGLREQGGPASIVETMLKQAMAGGKDTIIESIRCVGEAQLLQNYGAKLLSIDASIDTRYERAVERGSETDKVTKEKFKEDEEREWSNTDPTKQNLKAVMEMADVKLQNDGEVADLNAQLLEMLNGPQFTLPPLPTMAASALPATSAAAASAGLTEVSEVSAAAAAADLPQPPAGAPSSGLPVTKSSVLSADATPVVQAPAVGPPASSPAIAALATVPTQIGGKLVTTTVPASAPAPAAEEAPAAASAAPPIAPSIVKPAPSPDSVAAAPAQEQRSFKLVGITGTIGSGKSAVVEFLQKNHNFTHMSVRHLLISIIKDRKIQVIKDRKIKVKRDAMTQVANALRKRFPVIFTHRLLNFTHDLLHFAGAEGGPAIIVEKMLTAALNDKKNCIIESIRCDRFQLAVCIITLCLRFQLAVCVITLCPRFQLAVCIITFHDRFEAPRGHAKIYPLTHLCGRRRLPKNDGFFIY